jgi:hypothetical protein
MDEKSEKITALNDAFLRSAQGGKIVVTRSVAALPPEDQQAILRKIQLFEDFNEANDPYGEHDFGSVEHNGQNLFWKIDCYDKTLTYGSEDPADPKQTTRVMTILYSHEY